MGTKSCTKILNFSTRFSCRRRFRNALYGEKILLMGKCFVWAWFDKLVPGIFLGLFLLAKKDEILDLGAQNFVLL